MTAADLDHDGRVDLAVAGAGMNGGTRVLFNATQ
jgi:hypothetical protein